MNETSFIDDDDDDDRKEKNDDVFIWEKLNELEEKKIEIREKSTSKISSYSAQDEMNNVNIVMIDWLINHAFSSYWNSFDSAISNYNEIYILRSGPDYLIARQCDKSMPLRHEKLSAMMKKIVLQTGPRKNVPSVLTTYIYISFPLNQRSSFTNHFHSKSFILNCHHHNYRYYIYALVFIGNLLKVGLAECWVYIVISDNVQWS